MDDQHRELVRRLFAAATTVIESLLKERLVAERPAVADETYWRETRDGGRTALAITDAGLQAIGVEVDRKTSKHSSSTKAQPTRLPLSWAGRRRLLGFESRTTPRSRPTIDPKSYGHRNRPGDRAAVVAGVPPNLPSPSHGIGPQWRLTHGNCEVYAGRSKTRESR